MSARHHAGPLEARCRLACASKLADSRPIRRPAAVGPRRMAPFEAKVAEREDKGLRAFVCALGDVDVADIKKLGAQTKTELPLTISVRRLRSLA